MAPIDTVDLTTERFGRWARRAGLTLPFPLSCGHAARVELDWDELLAVSEERVTVTNAVAPTESIRSPKPREMLKHAARILTAPMRGLYTIRAERATGAATIGVGLARGADGLVVIDMLRTVRLIRLPATDLANTLASSLPALRGYPMQPFELSGRALATLRGTRTTPPSARATHQTARASGLEPEQLEDLAWLQQTATADGLLAAVRYQDDLAVPGTVSARWLEGPAGAVLRRERPSGDVTFESATRSTMTSAMIAALAAAASPRGHSTSTTNHTWIRTPGENR